MHYPLIEHGGRGPVIHWAPATGFPAETYRPIYEAFADRYRLVTMPPRALWPGIGAPPDAPGSWEEYAVDVDAGLTEHGVTNAILVGHSFGGVASMVAAVRNPGRYRALVMLDPTLLPEPVLVQFRAAKATGWQRPMPHPLARRARERRNEFATRDEAFAAWRGRKLFADWSDAALWRYVESGLRPAGAGFELRWSPAWEAHDYESIYTEGWSEVARIPAGLPVLVINGGTSDTFGAESVARFKGLAPGAVMETVPGFGHLFPQAAPGETAERIGEWLAGLR